MNDKVFVYRQFTGYSIPAEPDQANPAAFYITDVQLEAEKFVNFY